MSMGLDDGLLDEMLTDFLDESDEILGSLNDNLLRLDDWVQELTAGDSTHCDDDLMNEMFRGAHSLKGLSGMLGLNDINTLTHKVENIFDAARNDQLTLTSDIVELIFQSVDKLTGMIDLLKDSSSDQVDCKEVLSSIETVLQGANAEHVQVSAAATEEAFSKMQADMEETDEAPESPATSSANAPDAPAESLPEKVADHFADIFDEAEVSPKYLAIFLDESEDALEVIDEVLMGNVSAKGTETLMIQCHKIKGSAASLGLRRAAKLAHFMEDLLQGLIQAGKEPTEDMTEAMLRCTEELRDFMTSLRRGENQSWDFHEVYELLVVSQSTTVAVPPQVETEQKVEQETKAEDTPIVQPSVEQATPEPKLATLSEESRKELVALAPQDETSWGIQVVFDSELPLPGLKASLVHDRLCDLGTVFHCEPPESELQDIAVLESMTLGVTTNDSEEKIKNKLQLEGIASLYCEQVQVPEPSAKVDTQTKNTETTPVASKAPPTEAKSAPEASESTETKSEKSAAQGKNKKPAETLRVDIERLDHLMNLAGQLVINKARFSQIGDGLKSLTSSKQASHSLKNVLGIANQMSKELEENNNGRDQTIDLESLRSQHRRMRFDLESIQREIEQFTQTRNMVNDLSEAVHQLDRVADGIQKTVMDTRMVAIGPLFRRFKRVIRDITRSNGKDIQLVIRGENTELDKRMIDELGDPLIHMIRNCADHGIELPEDREAAGKPKQGTVTLDAFHQGNSILIEIRDDGKGLAAEKIRQKAIDKGIITASDAEKLSTHQLYQLIWEPGLSTAEQVTEVSGRGMGMDIVRTKIEEISGTVELSSSVGEGTTITIKLPLTLAILPSLLVEIEGDVIAMPVEAVSEIVRINEEEISTVHGMKTATVRGRVVSVTHLSELFDWHQPPRPQARAENEEQSLVILGSDGAEVGLVVDRLVGEEDIVIKSMAENYRNVDGIAGASILGDGRVSLILDVGVLLEMSAHANQPDNATKETV